jgi:DNA-directed RNA polymerase I subunit RPA43
MSSEDASQEKKRHRKHRGDELNSSHKKRKRSEHIAEAEVADAPPRKHRKSKHRESDVDGVDEPTAERVPKKQKNLRHEAAPELNGGDQVIAKTESVDIKPKKKQKKSEHHGAEPNSAQDPIALAGIADGQMKEHTLKSVSTELDSAGSLVEEAIADATAADVSVKKKKRRKHHSQNDGAAVEDGQAVEVEEESPEERRRRKQEKRERRVHKFLENGIDAQRRVEDEAPAYPFYTQTISIFVPVYPSGFANPHAAAADQHLSPLVKRYSSLLKGVLLAYRNPRVSVEGYTMKHDKPQGNADQPQALLLSVNEYAVGFGRLTAEMDLFKPARGAPMAGTLILQSEGHIGVVCWGMFNASIEAKRLPKGWKWFDLAKRQEFKVARRKAKAMHRAKEAGEDQLIGWETEDESDADELAQFLNDGEEADPQDDPFAEPVIPQLHTTGFWLNERGNRVKGLLHFRIKNFDVGLGAGADYGFLSLEGTMLTEEEEVELITAEKAEEEARKSKRSGLLRPELRRVPEFAMTRFTNDQEEEDVREVVISMSRPMTPDD